MLTSPITTPPPSSAITPSATTDLQRGAQQQSCAQAQLAHSRPHVSRLPSASGQGQGTTTRHPVGLAPRCRKSSPLP